MVAAAAGAALILWQAVSSRERAHLLVPLGLAASAALPAYAFYSGHPFRVRYMATLIVAAAVSAGLGAGLLRRGRTLAAAALVLAAVVESPPLDRTAALVAEAQWDRPWSANRRAVTRCLTPRMADEKILVSMGSLAHYMQEMAAAGYEIRDFIHEGNGSFWAEAIVRPYRHARWILIEELAEGGDILAARAKASPEFLDRFTRVCEGGGVALYRRSERP
jgi:hypothetical protein